MVTAVLVNDILIDVCDPVGKAKKGFSLKSKPADGFDLREGGIAFLIALSGTQSQLLDSAH